MSEELVAVVGLGLLGRGIAASLLIHGFRVIGCDRSPDNLAKAERSIAASIEEAIGYGAAPARLAKEWRSRYQAVGSIDDLASASFVIESITEDVTLKGEAFDEIERVVADDAPIASNTSAIPISVAWSAVPTGRRPVSGLSPRPRSFPPNTPRWS